MFPHEIQKYNIPYMNIQMQRCPNPQCDLSTKRSESQLHKFKANR